MIAVDNNTYNLREDGLECDVYHKAYSNISLGISQFKTCNFSYKPIVSHFQCRFLTETFNWITRFGLIKFLRN